MLGGASGLLAAAVAVVLLLSAGSAPTAAQGLPILRTRATHITDLRVLRTVHALASESTGNSGSLLPQSAHTFSGTDFTGYLVQSQGGVDGSAGAALCLLIAPLAGTEAGQGSFVRANCGPTAQVEQTGMLMSWTWTPGDYDFVALVPAGGSVTVTADGSTTSVPGDASGVASGVVHDNATVSLQVGSSTVTRQLGPDADTTPAAATGSTSPTAPTP